MMEELLRQGLGELGLSADSIPALTHFSQLLLKKNEVMNLTAITEPDEVARLHLLDSLELLKLTDFTDKRVVDVGTGAGFPGMPLHLQKPDFDLTLLDSLGKRVDFLSEACAELGMERVACVHARAEEFAKQHRARFDIAVSRAVAPLPVLLELCLPMVAVGGVFLAMKSVDSDAELALSRRAIQILSGELVDTVDYTIPCSDVTHRVYVIRKTQVTPGKYPRAYARIIKQPL